MQAIFQDIRFAIKLLRKNPGFAITTVLTLALGIGATTTIFSVVSHVLLNPLPYPDSDRLVRIWSVNKHYPERTMGLSYPDFLDLQRDVKLVEQPGSYIIVGYNLWGGREPERIRCGLANRAYFLALGAEPILGRLFLPQEEAWGNHRVSIISESLWRRRFGADPLIIGKPAMIDGFPYVVVGVLGAGFKHPVPGQPDKPDLWRAFALPPGAARDDRALEVLARLKPGVSVEQAQAEMSSIAAHLEERYEKTNRNWGFRVVPLQEQIVGGLRRGLVILLGAVAFVLLISCANVANLLLARAGSRRREIAIRTVLGANRGRLVQQLLTESVLLAVLGGALGLLLARWTIAGLVASHAAAIPRLDEVALDTRMLAFTLAVAVLTAIVFGLAPALAATHSRLHAGLRQAGALATAPGRRRLNLTLVAVEIALALVLLVGAGLLIRTFQRLERVDAGFQTRDVLTLEMALPWVKYHEDPKKVLFFDELLARVRNLPGVEAAAAVENLPLKEPVHPADFYIERRAPAIGEAFQAEPHLVTPGYFATMGIAMHHGRVFAGGDRSDRPLVAIVNRTMARRFWPGEEPLGQRISLGDPKQGRWMTIVGVVSDVRHAGLDTAAMPAIYTPLAQGTFWTINLVVRSKAPAAALAAELRRQVQSLDPDQAVYDVKTMQEVVAESLLPRRFSLLLLTAFAAIALVLAVVGVYGVMSYSIVQRTRELGLRMTLGAQRSDVLRLLVREGAGLVLLGIVTGALLAFALTRLMSSLLYDVQATDAATFTCVVLLMLGVALAANYVPARRATSIDPMTALRVE
jgi:predicted permease